jgi:hypothetical protein
MKAKVRTYFNPKRAKVNRIPVIHARNFAYMEGFLPPLAEKLLVSNI